MEGGGEKTENRGGMRRNENRGPRDQTVTSNKAMFTKNTHISFPPLSSRGDSQQKQPGLPPASFPWVPGLRPRRQCLFLPRAAWPWSQTLHTHIARWDWVGGGPLVPVQYRRTLLIGVCSVASCLPGNRKRRVAEVRGPFPKVFNNRD